MKALAEFRACIESARQMVCFHHRANDSRLPETWPALVLAVKKDPGLHDLVLSAVKELFQLERDEWLLLSVEFYNKRCIAFHPNSTPTKKALEMLSDLPSEFVPHKDVFEKLVRAVESLDCQQGESSI